LIRINGLLQAKQESIKMQKVLNEGDIPDYDKIKSRDNPLDSVVKRFEENGYTPTQAFLAFDGDCDEVLTVAEIGFGLKFHKINLLDSEWKDLV
jgi:hypothetical protein